MASFDWQIFLQDTGGGETYLIELDNRLRQVTARRPRSSTTS